jgi:hypothetical protein
VDDSEFIEWVAGHHRQLLRSAYLPTGDLHRARDLVQEALVKVALRWSRPRTGNPAAYARDRRPRQRLLVAPPPSEAGQRDARRVATGSTDHVNGGGSSMPDHFDTAPIYGYTEHRTAGAWCSATGATAT